MRPNGRTRDDDVETINRSEPIAELLGIKVRILDWGRVWMLNSPQYGLEL